MTGRRPARVDGGAGARAQRGSGPRGAGAGGGAPRRAVAHRSRRDSGARAAHRRGRPRPGPRRPAVHRRARPRGRHRRGRAALPPLRQAAAARRPGRGAAALRRVQEQGPGSALRPVREGPPASPPQRRRAACLRELLAPRPAELEALREVREQPTRRRGHRGRAGLPELPPGSRSSLQHLRVGRRRPDRHLAGNRHPGMRTVPQALDHLLTLRNRGAAEGRHAPRAALRALPQPRPGLLETVRVLPADLAAVDGGVHALLPGPETEAGLHPAGRRCRSRAGPAPGGHGPRRPSRPHAGLAEGPRRPAALSRPSPPAASSRTRRSTRCRRAALSPTCGRCWSPRARSRPGTSASPPWNAGSARPSPGRRIPGTGRPCADTPSGITCAACAAASTAGPPPASRPRTCATTSPPPRRSWTGSPHAG